MAAGQRPELGGVNACSEATQFVRIAGPAVIMQFFSLMQVRRRHCCARCPCPCPCPGHAACCTYMILCSELAF